jgi:hypothetical protein
MNASHRNYEHSEGRGYRGDDGQRPRDSGTEISRTSGRPITFGWTFTDRHIAVIWETVCDDPKMIRVRTAYEVEPKRRKS